MKKIVGLMVFGIVLVAGAVYANDAGVAADAGAVAAEVIDAGAPVVADAGAVAADASASAEVAVDVDGDPVGFLKKTYDAAKSGQWWMLVSLIVMGLVWLARKFSGKIDWFKTDRGGAILAMSVGILGGMAHGILADGAPTLGMLTESIKVTVGAMGGYVAIKKSLFPSDKKEKAEA